MKTSRLPLLAGAVVLLLGAGDALLHAQAVKASLVGTISDATGAMVPGAKVNITEINTGFTRTMNANEGGNYVFGNLDPGVYRVDCEFTGFKRAIRDKVDVLVNSTVRVDLRLEPGQITESIEVAASAELLQTDRSDVSRKIEVTQIANLPLTMNRNFQGLMNIVPGTSRSYRPHSEFFNVQDSIATQVNGQSRLANNVQLEGIDNNQRTGLLTALIPPIEAIQTVDVSTSNFDAELGRAGGGVVNVSFKSGTNEFHGSLFEFNRVSRTGARNTFASGKAVTTFNQFGGTLGGPIRKNKTFFFADYQGIRDRRGDFGRWTIPTQDFRAGNLTAATSTIYDPATGTADGRGRSPFAGSQIPAARISPLARKILGFIPAPVSPSITYNYEKATVRSKDTESTDAKIDHKFSDNDTLMYRLSMQRATISDPAIYGIYGGLKGFAGTGKQPSYNTALNYTKIFSQKMIAEFRFGVMRYRNDAQQEAYGKKTSDEVGIRGVNLDEFTSGMTGVDIDGYSNPVVGFSASLPWVRAETNFDLVSNWTRLQGNHTLKVGVDIRRNRDDLQQTQTYSPRGSFRYRAGPTALNGDPRTSFGNSFAAFLLDLPNEVGRDLPGIFPTFRQTQLFTYVQDKWQVSPKLTLDFGLRHELYVPPTAQWPGGFSNYNPDTNSLELAGLGSIPKNMGLQNDFRNFAPRVGVAYRMNQLTVIRGGYGVTVDPSYPDDKWAFNYPVKQNNAYNAENTYSYVLSMAAGFPAPLPVALPSSGIIPNAPAQNYLYIPKNMRQGYLQAWNVTVQRKLPGQFVFEAGYVANHAIGSISGRNINAGLVPGAGAAGQPLNIKFGRRASTSMWVPVSANYNSLQMKFDRRFAGGFALTTAYTYGKAINFADDNGGFSNLIDLKQNRARAGFDRTHTWVQSFIYDLPFGRNKRFLQSGPGRWLLGDWQVNGIFSIYSGTPLGFGYSATTLNAPGNGNRPYVNGPVRFLRAVGPGVKYFDISAFSAPASATFGNVGRNILGGPGIVNLDLAVFRKFRITERLGGEFRMESFNFSNTPHFNNPGTTLGSANFGEVQGAAGDQRVFQFAVKIVF
ncbi:MAG: TonB-dependent receptor [Acidobacteria bacterium]|nr:TonB-dependent receptor [Acidobacteriota bacterium]